MRTYPILQKDDNASIQNWISFVTRERANDINSFNALPNTYITGRRVTKVPVSSTDVVIGSDFIGDTNFTETYLYFCVSNGSGGSVWRRISAGSF